MKYFADFSASLSEAYMRVAREMVNWPSDCFTSTGSGMMLSGAGLLPCADTAAASSIKKLRIVVRMF